MVTRAGTGGWIAAVVGAVAVCSLTMSACGTQGDSTPESGIERTDIVVDGATGADSNAETRSTRSARSDVVSPTPRPAAYVTEIDIASADGVYSLEEVESMSTFKKSKDYDVDGLTGATGAVYGFFGSDPYSRREVEVRIYPDHETALTVGTEFAEESTGPNAVLSSSAQRWDVGITQRRACRANTRGSHHSGRCDAAKFGDYLVAGNLIVLCEGLDSEAALRTCREFVEELP